MMHVMFGDDGSIFIQMEHFGNQILLRHIFYISISRIAFILHLSDTRPIALSQGGIDSFFSQYLIFRENLLNKFVFNFQKHVVFLSA